MVDLSKMGRGRPITYHPPKEVLDTETAEFLGLHAGDGYLSCGVWGLRCNLQDENMAQRIIHLARNVLGVEPCVRVRENTYEIRNGQSQIIRFFRRYGFIEGRKAHVVQIPNQIICTNDPEIIKAFLRGLFSSDGSFSFQKRDHSPRIDLVVRSKLLRDQFVELSAKVGFSFNKSNVMRIEKGFTKKSTGAFFNANLTSRKDVVRWMVDIGTLCDTHIKKFEIWQTKLNRASSPNSALLCGIGHALLPLHRELKTTLFRLLILSSQHAIGTYISLDKLPLRLQLMRHQAPQLEKARAS
jgi:hypothetical protein